MIEFLIVAMLNGCPRKIAKVSFVRKDASLHVVPYGPSGMRRYASALFPARTETLDIQTQSCEPNVHLSIAFDPSVFPRADLEAATRSLLDGFGYRDVDAAIAALGLSSERQIG